MTMNVVVEDEKNIYKYREVSMARVSVLTDSESNAPLECLKRESQEHAYGELKPYIWEQEATAEGTDNGRDIIIRDCSGQGGYDKGPIEERTLDTWTTLLLERLGVTEEKS